MFWRSVEEWLDRVPLRRQVVELLHSSGVQVYLVGGTVRDALLGRDSYDLDFAVAGNAIALARKVADAVGGALVVLDAERDVARVVRRVGGTLHFVDLAGLRAPTIVADLWLRDFTVNAMALSLGDGWGALSDPTGGRRDLDSRVLRAVTDHVFRDDPLRMLRAVRLRGTLEFTVDVATERLLRRDRALLRDVSPERVRDELFQILGLTVAAAQLAYARDLGLLEAAQPDVRGGLAVLSRFEARYGACLPGAAGAQVPGSELPAAARAYHHDLARHWKEELSQGRDLGRTAKLAALLTASVDPAGAADNLRLSRREADHLDRVVAAARYLSGTAQHPLNERLPVYRYYRAYGSAGVDGALLAPLLAAKPRSTDVDGQAMWETIRRLLHAWFRARTTLVDPPSLLSGHDVLALLGGRGGPLVGDVLEAVREAQVAGLVRTREEALALAAARSRQRRSFSRDQV